jgi:hypothetical protein
MGRTGSEGLLSGGVQMRRGFVSRLGRRVSEVDYVEIAGCEGNLVVWMAGLAMG